MKVNIKGLVFVGFAAAILSANAMAANEDKTVTSKAYTDATYQVKSSQASIGSTGGSWVALATTVDSNSTDATAPTAAAVHSAITSASQPGNFIDTQVDSTVTNKAPSDQAVYNYVGRGTLTVNQNSVSAGTFGANDTTSSAINIVAPNWDAAENTQSGILNKPTITNDSSVIDTAESTDTKVVPTTYAVKQYVDAADSALQSQITALQSDNVQANWNETNTEAASYIQNKPQDIVNVLNGVQVDGTDLTIDGDKKVNLGAAAGADLATEVANSDTGLVSGDQVYDYVQGITHGNNIPAQDPSKCTDSTPCALVAELNTSTNEMEQHWRVMAVSANQSVAAGTLADAQ